jgi:two-component system, LytTR family, response regulator
LVYFILNIQYLKTFDCIIVDDEEVDRLTVVSYAKRFSTLRIVGVFENAEEALAFLSTNVVDVAFLDIELEGGSGLQLRQKTLAIPVCIFITSHTENAAEAFELQTLDFIVKPFNLARFEQTMRRVEEFMEVRLKASLFESSIGGDTVYIKSGHDQIKVKLHEILYLEALKNYTVLVTDKKRHYVLSNLGEMLREEKFNSFIRIHRSYAIQKQFVQKINPQEIQLNNNVLIPIGRSYKNSLSFIL